MANPPGSINPGAGRTNPKNNINNGVIRLPKPHVPSVGLRDLIF
jgi:hypothetical protein